MSVPQKDPVFLEELCKITALVDLGQLRELGWAFGNESLPSVVMVISQCLKSIITCLWLNMIRSKHHYFVVLVVFRKTGG